MIDFSSRQLRAFLLVAQHHNFTRAAEALFITTSGLSLLIRELENQLGFRLFDRTTRHVALTTQGRQLLAAAHRSLEDLDDAMSRIGQTVRQASDTLSVGAGQLVAANILPQAIKEFRSERPGLRIEVFDADPATILQKVRAGTLDMGLGSFKNTPGVRRTLFFRFSLMVIRPDSPTALRRTSTTWSALKGERLILPAPDARHDRSAPRASWRGLSPGDGAQPVRYAHRHGRSGRRDRDCSVFRPAGVSAPTRRHEPADQPDRARRLPPDSKSGPQALSSGGRIHHIPAGLHRSMGGACGRTVRMR